jgi:hypothetical protein
MEIIGEWSHKIAQVTSNKTRHHSRLQHARASGFDIWIKPRDRILTKLWSKGGLLGVSLASTAVFGQQRDSLLTKLSQLAVHFAQPICNTTTHKMYHTNKP